MYKKMREGKNKRNSRPRKPFKRKRRRPCLLCEGKTVDYKDVALIKRFISDRGKILPTRNTGCCAKHQRTITKLVKRSRQAGLIPYTID